MRRYILEIVCDCHAHITMRFTQEKNGDKAYVQCWQCAKSIEANGTSVKIAGMSVGRNRVIVILDEVAKKN